MIAPARLVRPIALLAGVLAVAACGSSSWGWLTGGQASGVGPVDGLWRSDGYGWAIKVADGQAQTYETTSLSCIPEKPLRQVDGPAKDGAIGFGKRASPDNAQEMLRRTDGGHATLRLLGTAADIDLVAIPSLPDTCSKPTPQDPLTTFDVFWSSLAENYNSTARKHVDWNALRHTYRPQVSDSTTPGQLHQILTDMVRPLGDAHIEISGGDNDFAGYRPGTRYTDGPGGVSKKAAVAAIDEHLQRDLGTREIKTWAGGAIAYADLPDGRGYLRFTNFQDWNTKPDDYLGRQALLDQVMDEVISDQHVKSWRGLVIDVGYNDGGDDQLGLSLAARLTDKPYTAYTKIARNDPNDPTKYGRARVVTVQPALGKPHYTGPIRVITSDVTISAGETLIEALMDRNPAPTRYGMATQGVFADNPNRTLPNGWTLTIGNEDYIAPDGRNYEGPGIAPTTPVPMYTPDQLANHQYPALDLNGDEPR